MQKKHGMDVRAEAAGLFEQGLGDAAVSTRLGLARSTVEKWLLAYRAIGREAFLDMADTRRTYSWDTKVAAAAAVVDGNLPKPEAMRRFGIANSTSLDTWCRQYRAGGPDALRPKPKGRPKAPAAPATREQELERRIAKLEAENAYLKKSIALKAERRSRTARRPRP